MRKFGNLFFDGFDLNTTHRAMMAIRKSTTGFSCSYVEMPAYDVASVSVELNGESLPALPVQQRVKHSVWEGDVFSTQIDCISANSAKSLEMGATVGVSVTSALSKSVVYLCTAVSRMVQSYGHSAAEQISDHYQTATQ